MFRVKKIYVQCMYIKMLFLALIELRIFHETDNLENVFSN